MTATIASRAAIVLVSGLLLAGCAAGPSAPASPSASAAITSPVTGVVVSVDATGLEAVRGFRLRTADGGVVELTIPGPLENAAEFPLGHLTEHKATAVPIRVWFRRSGDVLDVTRIEDAG